MSGVNEIRRTFLDYFAKNNHEKVASGPLVPRNDPSLMFVNAGMVQFKNTFTGLEKRPYTRAATAQKCVRAGGKHNDLDNVGYTARHHTFFEMLGNFSFGDYFKDDAIALAWNLVTKEFGINKDRLLVTVYHTDDEAANIWKKVAGLSDDRIIRIPTSDNFWSMGDTGPCGPCSEIFYDHGDHIAGGPPGSPDEDGDRFIEIWNLVFMQYEQISKDERIDLPKPSIDTGMGLERLAALLQGKHDNYDIDLFQALINASQEATGVSAEGKNRASHRIIADHLRASSFLIADGVLPANEGRGYVLRRIMRRAMRHAQLLGAQEPLMWRLVPTLVREMGQAYPELQRGEALISETLKLEETRFRKTLVRGLGLLEDATSTMITGDKLDGETAFKLYDTYGFPLDLTQDALRQRDIDVDTEGFKAAMERQKQEARANWKGSGEASTDTLWFELREKCGASEFYGYDSDEIEAHVLAIVKDGASVEQAVSGNSVSIIANQTVFYGESGGQMSDIGVISGENFVIDIDDVQKKADGLFVHSGTVRSGCVKLQDNAQLAINHQRRNALRANHSATHLLHEALRQVLGTHVAQKGSLVAPDRLRFDFSHTKPIDDCDLEKIEIIANKIVLQNSTVTTRLMAVDDAIAQGAMALFGEKYGDEVRVVSMGRAIDGDKAGNPYSVELCGGTHVVATGDIGLIRIVGESGVAAGVRRLEALCGEEARQYLDQQERNLKLTAAKLKISPSDVPARVEALIDERRKLERELNEVKRKLALGGSGQGSASNDTKQVAGTNFMGKIVEGVSPKDLKPLADDGKQALKSGVVVFIGIGEDQKASIVVGVTKDVSEKFSAVDLVRVGSAALGGKGGGGRADMAQAGGPDGSKAQEALDAICAAMDNS